MTLMQRPPNMTHPKNVKKKKKQKINKMNDNFWL